MAIQGYFDIFPEKWKTELRTARFENVSAEDPLPDGTFLFTEYFCTDPACDCQRVLVKVLHARSEDARPEDVATISYSWNPSSIDKWTMEDLDLPNPFLDPFHRQASYASELLDFWSMMFEQDKVYASRIQRHYHEIRAEVGRTETNGDPRHSTNHTAHQSSLRPLTKRDRKARKRRLARARKRK